MDKYSNQVKNNVRILRSQGLTYKEICRSIGAAIPKSTLSGWWKDIILPGTYKLKLTNIYKQNILRAQNKNRKDLHSRLNILRNKNVDLIKIINKQVGILILATLYWCEGGKYPGHRSLEFGNSDTGMISLFLTLLRKCYKIDNSKLRLSVQCRADQDQIAMSKFWSLITGIPLSQAYYPKVDKRSVGKPTHKNNYHGVCVIDYLDTNLQCELQFLGEYLGRSSHQLMKN